MKPSKLTSRGQATVPKEVREFLGLDAGDTLAWQIDDDKIVVRKLSKFDCEWHKVTGIMMTEWASNEDDEPRTLPGR